MKSLKTLFRAGHSVSSLRNAKKVIYSRLTQAELEKGYFRSRVYQDKSLPELLNQVLVNISVQSSTLVDNADTLYELTRRMLGNDLSSAIIKKTVGRVFTGGSTFEDVLVPTAAYNRQGIPVFLDYVAEASSHHIPTDEVIKFALSAL